MSLLVICTIAVAGLSVVYIITRLRARNYPAETVEVISTLDVLKNAKNLRAYLHQRVLNSDKRFMDVHMPGRQSLLIKDAESAKVRIKIHLILL